MKILVHCHIFYPELWDELKKCILNLQPYHISLWVTLVKEDSALIADILKTFPNVQILKLENRGYDIAPFIEVINQINLSEFDFIIKLHTKRNIRELAHHVNYHFVYGARWRKLLLSFIATRKDFERTLELFQNNLKIGMSGNGNLWIDYDRYNMPWDRTRIEPELKRLQIHTKERGFLSGTMFICRAEIFRQIQHRIDSSVFSSRNDHKTDLAHAYEMLFGVLVYENGFIFEDYLSRPLAPPKLLKIRRLLFSILYRLHI